MLELRGPVTDAKYQCDTVREASIGAAQDRACRLPRPRLGNQSTFVGYVDKDRKLPYEVEHIWANHHDRHLDEFTDPTEFANHRNRLGDLVLLPKDFNASYGDMPYDQKVQYYNGQNVLARSLHPMAYENNPSFRQIIADFELPFAPYPESFNKADIDSRQALYHRLAEIIWSPARLCVEQA